MRLLAADKSRSQHDEGLTVDIAERAVLVEKAAACPNAPVLITTAT
jgi:hypothetical protein